MLLQEIKNIQAGKKDLRKFGLSVGGVLLVLGGVLLWREKATYVYFLSIGGMLLVLGLALPAILKPVYLVWMTFAVVMGWFMSRLILSVLFYTVFALVSLVSRLLGKQFLDVKPDPNQASYWHYRDRRPFDKHSCERQF